MAIGGIGSGINNIQLLRARQAFENTNKLAKNKEILKNSFTDEDVTLSISSRQEIKKDNFINSEAEVSSFSKQNKNYIGEIKEFMGKNNYKNLNEDEIKEALYYGTSILADYQA